MERTFYRSAFKPGGNARLFYACLPEAVAFKSAIYAAVRNQAYAENIYSKHSAKEIQTMATYRNNLSSFAIVAALGGAMASATSAYGLTFVSAQSAGEQSTASLIGLRVENSQGENLGDINYLVLDSAGAVTTAVIGVGGFLGIGEKNVGVPFRDVKMGNNKDGSPVAVVTATKDSLTAAPNYVWTEKTTMQQMKDDASVALEKAKESMSSNGAKPSDTPAPPATPAPTATP